MQPNEIEELRKKYGVPTTGYTPELEVNKARVTELDSLWGSETEQETPSRGQRIIQGIKEKGANVASAIRGEDKYQGKTAVERGGGATAQAFSAISTTAYNALPDNARKALDKLGGGIGKGINYITDKISENPQLQEFAMSEAGQYTERVLGVLSDLGIIAGEVAGASQTAKSLNVLDSKTTNLLKQSKNLPDGLPPLGPQSVGMPKLSTKIMNKVARVNPIDARKFKAISGGEDIGEYLSKTGNFDRPEGMVQNEIEKFIKSRLDVDTTLDKLPGVYKSPSLSDALDMIIKKGKMESSANIKAPYLQRAIDLKRKLNSTGVTMSDSNEIKRILEREVKLGYDKQFNASEIKKATYVDEALRNWQIAEAKKLGFRNLEELNKQTQKARFVADSLSKKIVSDELLNGLSLTDYIVVSGGNSTAIAGLLGKKILSSKGLQAKIAKKLYNKEIQGQIKPELKPTDYFIEREVSPSGFKQLPQPKAGSKLSENLVPVKARAPFSAEKPASVIKRSTKATETKLLPEGKKGQVSSPTLKLPVKTETKMQKDLLEKIEKNKLIKTKSTKPTKVASQSSTLRNSIQKAKASGQSFDEWLKDNGISFNKEVSGNEKRLVIDLFPDEKIRGKGITKQETLNAFRKSFEDGHTIIEPSNGLWTKEGKAFIDKIVNTGVIKKMENRGGIIRFKITNKINQIKTNSPLKAEWDKVKKPNNKK